MSAATGCIESWIPCSDAAIASKFRSPLSTGVNRNAFRYEMNYGILYPRMSKVNGQILQPSAE